MNIVKENACEVDTKFRILRKKVVNFACGYVGENANQLDRAKQIIAAHHDSLEKIETECMDFITETDNLVRLMSEAEAAADKIYARLSEFYADCRLDMPQIEEEDLPIGIPLSKLVVDDPEDIEECSQLSEDVSGSGVRNTTQDVTNGSGVGNTTESETEEYKPNIFISRPSTNGGPPTWTPMIKATKKIL